jgi:hypothetical protein
VLTRALIGQVKLAAFAKDETVTAFVAAVLEREVAAPTAEGGPLSGEEVEMLHRLAAERGFASARDMIRDFARMGAPAPKPGSGVPSGSCGAPRARTSSRVANATVGSRATPSEATAPRATRSPPPVETLEEEIPPEPPLVAHIKTAPGAASLPDATPVYQHTPTLIRDRRQMPVQPAADDLEL